MTTPTPSYGLLTADEELEELVRRLGAELKPVGFDIETSYDGEVREKAQLHPEEGFIAGFSLTNSLAWGRYVALRHDSGVNLDNARAASVLWWLCNLRDVEGIPLIVAHGAVFEKRFLARWFLQYLTGDQLEEARKTDGYFKVRSCTMLESYVEAKNPEHGLKPMTLLNANHQMTEIMELFPAGLTKAQQNSIRFSELDQHDPKVYSYAGEDAVWALWHHLRRYPDLRNHPIYILEMALLEEVVPQASDFGVYYDWTQYQDASRRAHEFLPYYEADVRSAFEDATGQACDINFNSPPQLQKLLYEDMGLPVIKWTDGGKSGKKKPSTNAREVLVNYVDDHPAVAKFVALKELQTLCNNFLDTYERKFSYADDGMTHPNLLQHGTVSGRFAHDNPNYAQTSKKKYNLTTRDGRSFKFEARRAICAPPGWYMIGFDYSMVELRVVAGEAQEENLLEAFRNGIDVHKRTGVMFTGKAWEDLTYDDRQVGKTGNFSLGYGQSAKALAERLGISQERADELYAIYHASYPRLNPKRQEVIAQARRDGFVITKFGRKVPLPDIWSANKRLRDEAERTAGNVFVQGPGSGDYPKMAMVRANRALRAAGLQDDVKLVMNIHDALEFYARKHISPAQVIRVLAPAVVFPVPGWPPIVADWHMGMNWAEFRELEVDPDFTVRIKGSGSAPAKPKPEVPNDPAQPAVPGVRPEGAGGPGGGLASVVRRVDVAPRHGSDVPRQVVIDCQKVPGIGAVRELVAFMRTLPGASTVTLRTPDGDVELPGTTSLGPEDSAEASVVLGGATVRYDEASVDMGALAEGLAL